MRRIGRTFKAFCNRVEPQCMAEPCTRLRQCTGFMSSTFPSGEIFIIR